MSAMAFSKEEVLVIHAAAIERFGGLAGLRTRPLGELCLDLLAAIEQALDRAGSGRLFVKNVKDRLDRPDDDMQRNAAFLPRLDQRPVERAQKQIPGPPPDERVFDLGKIVEVIQVFAVAAAVIFGPLPSSPINLTKRSGGVT